MIPRRGSTERETLISHLEEQAMFSRKETVRLSKIAGAGHYASSFSASELFASLYFAELRIDPKNPKWGDRDRFVLSKGHAAIGLYPILGRLGFFDEKLLDEFTKFGNPFGDHQDMKKIPGVDFSSGSLGHGLSIAAGIALSGRISGSDHKTWCMLGDGELCEGQIWEAAMFAGHHKLGNLVAIVDNNQLCIDGFVKDVMNVEPIDERFASFGWVTRTIDGHDFDEILDTMSDLPRSADGAPQLIVAKTIKGRGVKRMELSTHWHVGNLVGQDYEDVLNELSGGLHAGTGK
jgi:transketolase